MAEWPAASSLMCHLVEAFLGLALELRGLPGCGTFSSKLQESPGQTRVWAGSCYFLLTRFKQCGIATVLGQCDDRERPSEPGLWGPPCSEEGGGADANVSPTGPRWQLRKDPPLTAGRALPGSAAATDTAAAESPPVESVTAGWRSPGPLSSARAHREN